MWKFRMMLKKMLDFYPVNIATRFFCPYSSLRVLLKENVRSVVSKNTENKKYLIKICFMKNNLRE